MIDRESDIMTSLVAHYRHGQLTNDQLRGSIGEIASLRWFREQLETDIRQGVMAAEVALGEEDGKVPQE